MNFSIALIYPEKVIIIFISRSDNAIRIFFIRIIYVRSFFMAPSKAGVIFIRPYIRQLAIVVLLQIVNKFVSSGIAGRQYDRVKLHMTLINSLFRQEDAGISENETGPKTGSKPDHRETFDTRPIFKAFADHRFGKVQVSELHLSQRRSKKRGPENYYMPSAVVAFNNCG